MLRGTADQCGADTAPARVRFDPHCCNPWRKLRAIRHIGCDPRGRAKKCIVLVGDQREGNRRSIHVFAQPTLHIGERMAARFPPRLPNPLGNRIEESGALPQVGNGEGHQQRLSDSLVPFKRCEANTRRRG